MATKGANGSSLQGDMCVTRTLKATCLVSPWGGKTDPQEVTVQIRDGRQGFFQGWHDPDTALLKLTNCPRHNVVAKIPRDACRNI